MYAKRRIFVCRVATSEGELLRISLPGTSVNKGIRKGRGCKEPPARQRDLSRGALLLERRSSSRKRGL